MRNILVINDPFKLISSNKRFFINVKSSISSAIPRPEENEDTKSDPTVEARKDSDKTIGSKTDDEVVQRLVSCNDIFIFYKLSLHFYIHECNLFVVCNF